MAWHNLDKTKTSYRNAIRRAKRRGYDPIYAEAYAERIAEGEWEEDAIRLAKRYVNAYHNAMATPETSEVYARAYAEQIAGDIAEEYAHLFAICYESRLKGGDSEFDAYRYSDMLIEQLGIEGGFELETARAYDFATGQIIPDAPHSECETFHDLDSADAHVEGTLRAQELEHLSKEERSKYASIFMGVVIGLLYNEKDDRIMRAGRQAAYKIGSQLAEVGHFPTREQFAEAIEKYFGKAE